MDIPKDMKFEVMVSRRCLSYAQQALLRVKSPPVQLIFDIGLAARFNHGIVSLTLNEYDEILAALKAATDETANRILGSGGVIDLAELEDISLIDMAKAELIGAVSQPRLHWIKSHLKEEG